MIQKSLKISLICLVLVMLNFAYICPSHVFSQDKYVAKEEFIDFDTRISFYLDMKTKRFLERVSIKEEFLLQLIDNVVAESRARDLDKKMNRKDGYQLIYGDRDKLLTEYSEEIEKIIYIISQLDALEKVMSRSDDYKLLNEVDTIKDDLVSVLDNTNLESKGKRSSDEISMMDEYTKEVNSLLKLYDQIENFEKYARANNDEQLLKQLSEQKKRVLSTLETSRLSNPFDDRIVTDYIAEAENVVTILKELDKIEFNAEYDSIEINDDIKTIKNNLISKVDNKILELVGYSTNNDEKIVTITEYFREWKASRLAEIQIKLTQYRVIKEHLLNSSLPEERDRMLEQDMADALLNYSNENYELALLQFKEIYDNYSGYYQNLDGVLFYLNEANYANGYFESAYSGYTKIVIEYPDSQYKARIYSRLIFISFTYGWEDKFYEYYDSMMECENIINKDRNEANYLAGYLAYTNDEFTRACAFLENVTNDSEYRLASQYLLGVAHANINQYNQAIAVFTNIVSMENLPWTDINIAIIRNESLLKLGYIYYQQENYEQALNYFDQVSKGYEKYDVSLVGKAWANMQKGQYGESISELDELLNNFMMSNYTYESMVLSAHCKRLKNKKDDAIDELKYVSYASNISEQAKDYVGERKKLVKRLNELDTIEDKILDRQDKLLYPKIAKLRKSIISALQSYSYRGVIDDRIVEEYRNDKKLILNQISEFENIMNIARVENDDQMYKDAVEQRDKLLVMIDQFPNDEATVKANYFINYPLAVREQGYIYQRELVRGVMKDLILEKDRINNDLAIITNLLKMSDNETQMEIILDLEILEEDLRDLHNQIDRYQIWLSNNTLKEVNTNTDFWADVSGFSISDINFTSYQEQRQKIETLDKNLMYIINILQKKRDLLENRINNYKIESDKIEKELEAEQIRLEKLEKEKYFRDIYFDIRTREIETEEDLERIFDLNF